MRRSLGTSSASCGGYLECGILACGFARARCDACGHDFIVAFSCKGRGVCPSCTTRRMAETAAHLVEHVRYTLPKPLPGGQGCSRRMRRCEHACITACVGQAMVPNPLAAKGAAHPSPPSPARRRTSLHWGRLLARIYECRPLTCPRCEGEMRLVAFLTEPAASRAILAHLGEPTAPPPLAPRARAPPKIEPYIPHIVRRISG